MTVERSADEAILDSVFSSSRDRGADAAAPVVETPETPAETKATETVEKVDDAKVEVLENDAKPKGYRDPQTGRFVPLEELKTEREKRQEAQKAREEEARLRQIAEDNAKRYEAQVQQLLQAVQARPATPPPPPPDPLVDPEGAYTHLTRNVQQMMLNQALNFSERFARKDYGDEAVDQAVKAANDAGIIRNFINAPDAYGELVKWHRKAQALNRIGDDVDAYEKRVREEERQRVIEELRTGKASLVPGQIPPPQRLPGSLIDATASGPQGTQPISDEELARSVFGHSRKRK